MSKGGAGKVYFVLYLAVILELLIIIVERDEAEEHLIQKQKESMKIVESILSQLQTGAGSEGINTRPQDQITIPPPGVDIKKMMGGVDVKAEREYMVEVGITDVSSSLKQMEGEEKKDYIERMQSLFKLSNVQSLTYEVWNAPGSDQGTPPFPIDKETMNDAEKSELKKVADLSTGIGGTVTAVGPDNKSGTWKLLARRTLNLDMEQMKGKIKSIIEAGGSQSEIQNNLREAILTPVYPTPNIDGGSPDFRPNGFQGEVFRYDTAETRSRGKDAYKKRVFKVNFQPGTEGWFKLRFSSKTNRVLGIQRADGVGAPEADPETKVYIGTVQIKLKDLEKVQKELIRRYGEMGLPDAKIAAKDPDKFNEEIEKVKQLVSSSADANEKLSKIQLYSYIARLIEGQAANFDQNKGSIEFNIRVLKPIPPEDPPPVIVPPQEDRVVYSKLSKTIIGFTASPFNGTMPTIVSVQPSAGVNPVIEDAGQDQSAALSDPALAGKARRFNIVFNGTMPANPDGYTITLRHANKSGKAVEETAKVIVLDPKLTEDSRKRFENTIKNRLYYGQSIKLNPQPADGGKVPAGQYLMNVLIPPTQSEPVRGITFPPSGQVVKIPGNASTISADILWEDPVTKERISLLPNVVSGSPKQGPPTVNDASLDYKADIRTMKVTVTGIGFDLPPVDVGSNAEASDIFDEQANLDGDQEVKLKTGEKVAILAPQVQKEGDKYRITFSVKPPRALRKGDQISGTINFTFGAKVRGKSKESEADPKPISIPISMIQP